MEEKYYMRYCPTCAKQKKDDGGLRHIHGYVDESIYVLKDGKCTLGHDAIQLKMPCEDYDVLINLSLDPKFMQFMVDLCENNPVEYELKMKEYRLKADRKGYVPLPAQETSSNDIEIHLPKCPTCGSTDVDKISLSRKAFGGAMFGLFSSDVRNTMHCKNCGAKW